MFVNILGTSYPLSMLYYKITCFKHFFKSKLVEDEKYVYAEKEMLKEFC